MSVFIRKNALLLLILLFAFVVRLYRLDNPIADWHSWRQADTSAVSRNFVQHGYDILHPRFDDLSNIPSGLDNLQGYRFVEFPIYNIAQAASYQIFGILTLEEWGRIVSILSSIGATLFLYLLVTKYANKTTGLFSAFFYAFLPYNIYYGRTILPDPSMVMATLGALYFFDNWIATWPEKKKKSIAWYGYGIVSLLFTISAFLLKPYAGFFLLPMIVILYEKFGYSFWKKWQLYVFALVSIAPLVAWRLWLTQFPEGIPANAWLFNGNGIRFRPSFFRWIVYERLIKLISGYTGILLFGVGIYAVTRLKHWLFFASCALSAVLYVSIIATGNVQHDYYQILIMPVIAMAYGIGAYYLYSFKRSVLLGRILLVVVTISSFYFSWNIVKDYFNINNRAMVRTGMAIDKLIPKDATIIAPYDGDTSFLYQTNRKGWPSFEKDLPIMIDQLGADYLVILDPKPQDMDLEQKFTLVSKTKEYILVNLHKKP